MPTWREVGAAAAARRAGYLARQAEALRLGEPPIGWCGDPIAMFRYTDLEHRDPAGGFGQEPWGTALATAFRLSQIETERGKIANAEPSRASDDRLRTAQLRALDSEADNLVTQLDAHTSPWWPDKPPAGGTADETAARTGMTGPGPAPRAFLPKT